MLRLTPLLEVSKPHTIYLDMDGVLCDFDKSFGILVGEPSVGYEDKYGKTAFWGKIGEAGVKYWSEMPWYPGSKKMWNMVKNMDTKILSAPPSTKPENAKKGKAIWVKKNLGSVELILERNKQKYAHGQAILVDDRKDNIDKWKSAGGKGILFKSANQAISELKGILNG